MDTKNNIIIVRVPVQKVAELRVLRDYILDSLARDVLVLPEDASWEVMELPPLGGVEVEPAQELPEEDAPAESEQAIAADTKQASKTSEQAEEKRAIIQRLKGYRAAHGYGCLADVSAKTARRKDKRISDDILRSICADGAPKMELEEWRSIGRALDLLEQRRAADG